MNKSAKTFVSPDTYLIGMLLHRAVTILEKMSLFNNCGEKLFLTDSKKRCSALDMKRSGILQIVKMKTLYHDVI